MPIYEYAAVDPEKSCNACQHAFEKIQKMDDPPVSCCDSCGNPVKRLVSRNFARFKQTPVETVCVSQQVNDFEKEGKWSHAAELADSHSEKTGDRSLKTRALENYKKAGYDVSE